MCKLHFYGNCDRETSNQEYCIFHRRGKSEGESRVFYERLLERFGAHIEETPAGPRVVFPGDADFRGYVFPDIPDGLAFAWSRAVFKGKADFSRTVFEGYTDFSEALFEGEARFSLATFMGDADFTGARFRGRAGFSSADFEGNANFSLAVFEADADFTEAKFRGHAVFSGAEFRGDAVFDNVVFEGPVYFKSHEPPSSGLQFHGRLSFRYTRFHSGVFIEVPSNWFKQARAEAEARRVQRLFYEREGMRSEADRLMVQEMRAHRRARLQEAMEYIRGEARGKGLRGVLAGLAMLLGAVVSYALEYVLVDLTSEYGVNWHRPIILWIVAVLLVFPLLYMLLGGAEGINNPWDAVYFSVVTATTLGYGDIRPVGVGRLLASAEAIFGTFMWAVFLVVISRRYMR